MTCLQVTSFILLLSLAKGASAQVATGAVCTVAAGCIAATDICVPTVLKCLIKPGQTCVVATGNCVTGATCSGTSPTCSCDTTKHIAATPSDYCKLQVDQTCSSTTAPCLNNGECSATKCVCKTGYVASSDKNTCLLKAGQTGCTTDAQCTANSVCSTGTTRTCTCSTNYVAQTSGLCAPRDNTYGGSCSIANNVDSCVSIGADPNAVCSAASGGTCGCKSGYTATVGAKCSGAMNFAGSVFLLLAALILTTYLQ